MKKLIFIFLLIYTAGCAGSFPVHYRATSSVQADMKQESICLLSGSPASGGFQEEIIGLMIAQGYRVDNDFAACTLGLTVRHTEGYASVRESFGLTVEELADGEKASVVNAVVTGDRAAGYREHVSAMLVRLLGSNDTFNEICSMYAFKDDANCKRQ